MTVKSTTTLPSTSETHHWKGPEMMSLSDIKDQNRKVVNPADLMNSPLRENSNTWTSPKAQTTPNNVQINNLQNIQTTPGVQVGDVQTNNVQAVHNSSLQTPPNSMMNSFTSVHGQVPQGTQNWGNTNTPPMFNTAFGAAGSPGAFQSYQPAPTGGFGFARAAPASLDGPRNQNQQMPNLRQQTQQPQYSGHAPPSLLTATQQVNNFMKTSPFPASPQNDHQFRQQHQQQNNTSLPQQQQPSQIGYFSAAAAAAYHQNRNGSHDSNPNSRQIHHQLAALSLATNTGGGAPNNVQFNSSLYSMIPTSQQPGFPQVSTATPNNI